MPSTHQSPQNSVNAKVTLAIGACVLIGLAWLGYQHFSQPAENKKPIAAPVAMFSHQGNELVVPNNSPLRAHLKVAAVNAGAADQLTSFPGMVEANTALSANIEPPLTGRLVKLNVKLGDHVQKGQVLAVMSSGDLAQAYADVNKARDNLNLADINVKRAREVNAAGANATKDLQAAESAAIQAKSEYERATIRLHTLGGNGSAVKGAGGSKALLPIVAPISGEITTLNVGEGSFINDSTTAIMTIANLEQVWVSANIPEARLTEVRAGLDVNVELPAYPGQIFHGKISSISSVLDNDTRRNKARILFANTERKFKPNMFATVHIKNNEPHQIRVPQSALLMNNDRVTVFVEVKPNTYVRRVVELGDENEQEVQIVSGLNPSDRIIVSGGVLLND